MKNNEKYEVCYNMQAVVDSKYKFLVDFEIVNDINNQSQLSNMVTKIRSRFSDQKIITLADTGYFNMSE
ncbi:transposase, partial [Natranaerobius trueperi]